MVQCPLEDSSCLHGTKWLPSKTIVDKLKAVKTTFDALDAVVTRLTPAVEGNGLSLVPVKTRVYEQQLLSFEDVLNCFI